MYYLYNIILYTLVYLLWETFGEGLHIPNIRTSNITRLKREPPVIIYKVPMKYYGPPRRRPKPIYGPPRPIYGPPSKPKPVYGPPKPVYGPPKPIYGPPKPMYGPPQINSFNSLSSFGAPPSIYSAPPMKPPSFSYGPPEFPQTNYGAPPINTYGPPPNNAYGPPPSNAYGLPPSNSYGSPPINSYDVAYSGNSFGSSGSGRYSAPPLNSYGPPFKPTNDIYGPPNTGYGTPNHNSFPSTNYGTPNPPSSNYGPPNVNYGAPTYNPPTGGSFPDQQGYESPHANYAAPPLNFDSASASYETPGAVNSYGIPINNHQDSENQPNYFNNGYTGVTKRRQHEDLTDAVASVFDTSDIFGGTDSVTRNYFSKKNEISFNGFNPSTSSSLEINGIGSKYYNFEDRLKNHNYSGTGVVDDNEVAAATTSKKTKKKDPKLQMRKDVITADRKEIEEIAVTEGTLAISKIGQSKIIESSGDKSKTKTYETSLGVRIAAIT